MMEDNGSEKKRKKRTEKNKNDYQKKGSIPKWLKPIFRVGCFFLLSILGMVVFFIVLNFLNKTAKITIEADNISKINNINAQGIIGCFIDNYEEKTSKISFTDEVVIETVQYDEILTVDKNNGRTCRTDEVLVIPKDDQVYTVDIPYLKDQDRTDYEICCNGTGTSDQDFFFNTSLSYLGKGVDYYTYTLEAPVMDIRVYWPYNGEEVDYLKIRFENCETYITDYGSDTDELIEVMPEISIPVMSFNDKKVGGEWTAANLVIYSRSGEKKVRYDISPYTASKNADEKQTVLTVFYPERFEGNLSGKVSWKHGLTLKEYQLNNERMFLTVEKSQIYDTAKTDKEIDNSSGYLSIDEYDNTATFVMNEKTEHMAVPEMVFQISEDPDLDKRETKLQYDATVTSAEINEYNLFPNLRTYLIENWMTALILTFIMTGVSYAVKKE